MDRATNEAETFVFNIQPYSLHDGPGIRTIIFLKGCPMRCRWCCNPESQKFTPEISYVADRCIGRKECGYCQRICKQQAISFDDEGKAKINFMKCNECLKCANICPSKAIKIEGQAYTIKDLLDIVEKDAIFYNHGNGGLTVSGGEPLAHKHFLVNLLKGAKDRRINTAMETCGQAEYSSLFEAAKYLDTILFDIKSMNTVKHKEYTGFGNERILDNFTKLCRDYPAVHKKVRTPIIPEFNDTQEDIEAILNFIQDKPNVVYEALPYHIFGKGKYKALGRAYPMGEVKLNEDIVKLIEQINKKPQYN